MNKAEIEEILNRNGMFSKYNDAEEGSFSEGEKIMSLITAREEQLVERFDIELEAWMQVHDEQNRSFDTQSLVKHMRKLIELWFIN